jgi:hypothetical protein
LAALFTASLQHPVPPTLVADQILAVATSGTWQLRHLVGPDAAPFVGWRMGMSDESWTDIGALDDDSWFTRIEKDFGMDARPMKVPPALSTELLSSQKDEATLRS